MPRNGPESETQTRRLSMDIHHSFFHQLFPLAVSVLLVIGVVQARAERYKVIDLGILPGSSDTSVPHDINNVGQVVGESGGGEPSVLQGFLWENGTMTPLGFLCSDCTYLTVGEGINDAGQVVGSSGGFGAPTLAFIWDRINGMRSLGEGVALDINGSGQVVGFFGGPRAFLWDSVHGMQDLGYLPGSNDGRSVAFAINDFGQVVGEGEVLGGGRAFLWESTTGMTDLGTLPGGQHTLAKGINNKGQVVGYANMPSGETHAVLWDNGIPIDLGLGIAEGINDAGQVVGGGYGRAFMWDRVNGMRNLNDLIDPSSGRHIDYALAINGKGEIAATWARGTGYPPRAVLLTLVSEPTKISIDIEPGQFPNDINPKSKGQIPVAILTGGTFDATTVDPSTIRFGATGTEAAPVLVAVEDVNSDGRPDVLLNFNTQDTRIQCRQTSASLTGETTSRQAIQGSDSIITRGCK
jgi:probable HAF family extracellular repeat protein